jgi:hypothetical protein
MRLLECGCRSLSDLFGRNLNYHRQPLAETQVDSAREPGRRRCSVPEEAAEQLNRLYREKGEPSLRRGRQTREEAARRVRRVVNYRWDSWQSAHRVKISWIGNPWFVPPELTVFSIDCAPPIVCTLLDVKRPFVIA